MSRTIYHLLSSQFQKNPEANALLAPDRPPLTYQGLREQIDYVVRTLNTFGISRSDRVAIVLPNGPEMAAAFLSIAAGATSAPLNPSYPAAEYDFYLTDLEAKALVVMHGVDSPARAAAKNNNIPIIEISVSSSAPAGRFTMSGREQAPEGLTGYADADDVALVLHTSGTTSRPKIVPLTQSNLCASSANHIAATLQLTPRDRCLNVMPLFHIHGIMAALLSTLSAGASVVCTPGFYAPQFYNWMAAHQPTWYSAVPTMHQAILARTAANKEIISKYQEDSE